MYKKQRSSNLELLRIICILIIILSHYSVHGDFNINAASIPFNKFFIQSSGLGEIGVDCFIFISGYFLVNSTFNFKKLLKLELEVLLYSIGIAIIYYVVSHGNIGMKEMIKACLPTLSGQYWFMSAYILLYMLSPFINLLIKSLSQRMHLLCIMVLFSIYILIPTFTMFTIAGSSNIMLFITLYLIAAYIRLYPNATNYFNHMKLNIIMIVLSYIIIILPIIIYSKLGIISYNYFMGAHSLPLVVCSLSLFLAFKNMNISYNRIINWLAGSVLGVYLIHDNPIVRNYIWKYIFRNNTFLNSKFLVFHAIGAIIIIFVVCMAIDKIRISLVERPLWKAINPKIDKLMIKVSKCKLIEMFT
ncbi:acyltransferase family protein [Anaerosacchariphilus polymeriproducens]|uniref:Acyltransferase n=1 Tax=Anaerosacchariphilus polymeriproducens TaxID=1812858 RepID=A0A371ARJ7_9FIRM|nr:acyltransferase [Anaerosacchariphilus polymeriproducens]RDU22172.1 acyltransferase [Anaerosacchariphilus polymeriproducens]